MPERNITVVRPERSARPEGTFPTTDWAVVYSAGGPPGAPQSDALGLLLVTYWPPLYLFLRKSGLSPHDAEDTVQAFAAHLLAKEGLGELSPERGRFRTFLLTSLKNFQISQTRRTLAQKRGGPAASSWLDLSEAEAISAPELGGGLPPDKAYDRQWARLIMHRALERLASEYRQPKQERLFRALKPVLTDLGRVSGEAALAQELGMTPGALAVAASRMRQRFRLLIEDEVAHTLGEGGNLAEELQALREAWL